MIFEEEPSICNFILVSPSSSRKNLLLGLFFTFRANPVCKFIAEQSVNQVLGLLFVDVIYN